MTTTADRAAASAAFIREQSEHQIRAQAHRLAAGHRAALRTMSAERRRSELLALAEKVAAGEQHTEQLVAAVLPYLSDVSNAAVGFEVLVQAVRERGRFTTDADGWLAAHGLGLDVRSWESMDDSTLADVDDALDALCGVSR